MSTRDYDNTVARIAGNLLSDLPEDWLPGTNRRQAVVTAAVATAYAIVDEIKRVEIERQAAAAKEATF